MRAEGIEAVTDGTMQDWYARCYPNSPLNADQRRCLLVLQAWKRLYNIQRYGDQGTHGGFMPFGDGIEVRCKIGTSLSTFDDDGLTRLVLAAHRYCCRVQISAFGVADVLRIVVHPREPDGERFYERHPSLSDLAAAIEEHG